MCCPVLAKLQINRSMFLWLFPGLLFTGSMLRCDRRQATNTSQAISVFKAIAHTIRDPYKAVFKISHCINLGMEWMSDWTKVKRDRRSSQHDFQDLGTGVSGLFKFTITSKLKTIMKSAQISGRRRRWRKKRRRRDSPVHWRLLFSGMLCSVVW